MKKLTAILLSFLLVLALCACGSGAKGDSMANSNPSIVYDSEVSEDKQGSGIYDDSQSQSGIISADSAIYDDPDAKIIRTATMTIQTVDFDQSVTDLAALTETYGGYYETAKMDGGGYYNQNARRYAYYVVRIPKENFVAFRDSIGSVGYIYSFTEGVKNVGEEYYDTEARLETLNTKRERLLALLDKAELMEDIITLEDALAEVQYEIDMHNTTLRKYDSLIDYSTFTIDLNEVVEIKEEPGLQESFGSRLLGQLTEGFSDFADGLQNFALWFARNIISLVILAVIIVVVVRIILVVRKKRRGKINGE